MKTVTVLIHFREQSATEWGTVVIAPERYFEDSDERPWKDATPKFQHASDYLEVHQEQIEQTVLEIRDEQGHLWRRVVEFLWAAGKNRLIDVTQEEERLTIVQIVTHENVHTVRYDRSPRATEIFEHHIDNDAAISVTVSLPPAPLAATTGEITYDLVMDEDMEFIEGCVRLDGGEWQVLIVSKKAVREPTVRLDTWDSGVSGYVIFWPSERRLAAADVEAVLGSFVGVERWVLVRGPDSMILR